MPRAEQAHAVVLRGHKTPLHVASDGHSNAVTAATVRASAEVAVGPQPPTCSPIVGLGVPLLVACHAAHSSQAALRGLDNVCRCLLKGGADPDVLDGLWWCLARSGFQAIRR